MFDWRVLAAIALIVWMVVRFLARTSYMVQHTEAPQLDPTPAGWLVLVGINLAWLFLLAAAGTFDRLWFWMTR